MDSPTNNRVRAMGAGGTAAPVVRYAIRSTVRERI
jgi:hypothetical protein